MAYNRELSQFASLVGVNDTSKQIGISTDLNVSGIVTATHFYGSGRFLTDVYSTPVPASGGKANQIQYNDGSVIRGSEVYYTSSNQNVGIGSSIPASKLDVIGNAKFTGVVTATTLSSTNATITNLTGTAGTITTFNSTNAAITNLTGTLGTCTNFNATNLVGTALSFSGISTFRNGPVFIGAATSTGTSGQVLQVAGVSSGVYIGGNLGIGTTNPAVKLDVIGNVRVSGVITCTDLNSTSDVNLKMDIHTIQNALSITKNLRGVSFSWRETSKPSIGIIAQELEKILPELVTDGNPKTVNYNGLIGVLIESIKELSEEVEQLKKHLNI